MRHLYLYLFLVFCCTSIHAQTITGTWSGRIDLGIQKLTVVFHIEEKADGYWASMDSPDQNAKGLPVSAVEYNHPDLKVSMPALQAEYSGRVKNDSTIDGIFAQLGASYPLVLTKGYRSPNRPQTPQPPYDYDTLDVLFPNGNAGIALAGTISRPRGEGRFPAAVLISGSGPQDRNSALFNHKPFWVLADYLTRRGICVLRYDDRGVGGSGQSLSPTTTEDVAGDALCAIEFLRQQPWVDTSRIGLIGHSEGGTAAFMAAARDTSVTFVVSMAGSVLKGSDVLLAQNLRLMNFQNSSPQEIEAYGGFLTKVYELVETMTDQALFENMTTIMDTLSYGNEKSMPDTLKKNIPQLFTELSAPWFRYFLKTDPAIFIQQMGSTPIFALYGSKDCQVDADSHLAAIRKNSRSPHSLNRYRKYDGLNHLFQSCATGAISEYAQIEETICEQVLNDVADWILSLPGEPTPMDAKAPQASIR